MSTTFLGQELAGSAAAHAPQAGNFFSRIMATYARHQEEKAARFVRPYLRAMSDRDLAMLGHSPAEIAAIRKETGTAVVLWP